MQLSFPYLSTIVLLPVVGAIIIALLGNSRPKAVKYLAAIFTLIPLVLAVALFVSFSKSSVGVIQFEEKLSWITPLNAFYHLGVDGLSLPLVILTAFLGFMVVLISWKEHLRVGQYFAWLLLLETSILGVFSSLDLLLFFVFWEIEIIPMYFLISIWGSGRKEYSAMKYVIYTLLGSAFMLAGILSLYLTTGSLDMVELSRQGLGIVPTIMPAAAMFFLMIIGFAIKLPVVPFH
ncbi:MAG: proton-conducting transporter membrane subunit, partial [Dehalococcoidales bacterium]|nr:proton-conducting transporter membrane subunit [Dehalococcoidales bacterium]